MADLPSWLPQDLSNAKLETIGPRLKLTGQNADPDVSLGEFLDVVWILPPGYVLSRARIDAEHARGKRLTWEVVWLKAEVAERRYQEKQATRMSRYEVHKKRLEEIEEEEAR